MFVSKVMNGVEKNVQKWNECDISRSYLGYLRRRKPLRLGKYLRKVYVPVASVPRCTLTMDRWSAFLGQAHFAH